MSFIKFLSMVQYNLLFSLIPGTHSQFTNLVNVVKKPKTYQLCYKLSRHAHEDGPEREIIRFQAVLIGCLFFFCLFSCMNNTGTFWPNFTIEPVRLYKLIKQQHLPHSHHTTEHRAFAPLLTDHKTQYHCKHSHMLLYICTVQLIIKFSLSKCAYFTFLCIQYMHLIKFVIVLLFLYFILDIYLLACSKQYVVLS